MNLVVCINQIPDPEAPASRFRLQAGARQPEPWTGNLVMGPFDENALELALQLKERGQGKVHAISVGESRVHAVLRKAYAVKVDEAICVSHDPADLDSNGVARLLAAAIRQIGDVDLVLCGRQSGDWDTGQVGPLLAEQLGYSAVALVRQVESFDNESMIVKRELDDGLERVEVALPAVLTVTNDVSNQLRMAKVRDIMMADRKPIRTLSLQDLGVSRAPQPVVRVQALQPPLGTGRRARMVGGETPEEKAHELAESIVELLREG